MTSQAESKPIMNTGTIQTPPAFQTKHLVFGKDVTEMSTYELINSIKRVEQEIAELSSVKTFSGKISDILDDLRSMLVKIVEILDARR